MHFELSSRDRQLVQLISQLNQASTAHIKDLLFPDVSRVSMDRAIKRLVTAKYLARVGKRASGPKGGTPPAVYMLGPKGWWYCNRTGKYWGFRAVSEHSLKVADLFTALVVLDHQGQIKLLHDTSVEFTVGHMRADLYADIALPSIGKRRRFYVEVQLSARADLMRKKFTNYWDAYEASTQESWPRVAVVCFDPWVKHEIAKQVPEHMKDLFAVWLPNEFIFEATHT